MKNVEVGHGTIIVNDGDRVLHFEREMYDAPVFFRHTREGREVVWDKDKRTLLEAIYQALR